MFPEMRIWCDIALEVASEHETECMCEQCEFCLDVFVEAHDLSKAVF